MSILQFLFIVMTVVALSFGQILFKMAATSMDFSAATLLPGLLNTKLIVALVVYFFATVMWLLVLRSIPLRVAYPFAALAFFLVPVLAHFLLNETISWNTFAGASLIALGVWVSVYQ